MPLYLRVAHRGTSWIIQRINVLSVVVRWPQGHFWIYMFKVWGRGHALNHLWKQILSTQLSRHLLTLLPRTRFVRVKIKIAKNKSSKHNCILFSLQVPRKIFGGEILALPIRIIFLIFFIIIWCLANIQKKKKNKDSSVMKVNDVREAPKSLTKFHHKFHHV